MAKAKLLYDLNDPDDSMAHLRAVKSLDMALVLWEIAYNTKKGLERMVEEHPKDGGTINPYDIIDKFYENFWEELNDRGINLNELIV